MRPEDIAQSLEGRTARALGISRLYRYVPYDTARLALLLKSKIVRVSNPTFFNDPYDCRPLFDARDIEDPNDLERFLGLVRQSIATWGTPDSLEAFDRSLPEVRASAAARQNLLFAVARGVAIAMPQAYRLLCLGTSPFEQLLWSHYANGHRGICIEFDATMMPFAVALSVTYSDEYPRLDFSGASPDTFIQASILTKASYWAYENEFRLITAEIDGTIYPRSAQDMLELPERAVTAVIVGQQFPLSKIDEVQSLIRRFAPHVELRVMSRNFRGFKLDMTTNALDHDFRKGHPK